MDQKMRYLFNNKRAAANADISYLNISNACKTEAFHASFEDYEPTPLLELKKLASMTGLDGIYVKDESKRFDINAFKALGASFAIASYISELTGCSVNFSDIAKCSKKFTFATATDGNHGRAVAWTAKRLGHNAVIYLPKGTAQERVLNIQKEGAEAIVTDLCYDDAVKLAAENAEKNGWILIQDTAWEGYEEIPKKIMQGYLTMALEAYDHVRPTHIFLQAGVGSMAAAVVGLFANAFGGAPPIFVIVEPNEADCIFRSAEAGKMQIVTEDMNTIMAGLACGCPSSIALPILLKHADCFVTCSNTHAATAMRVMSSPMGDDPRITAGESGASTMGALLEMLMNPEYTELRHKLNLNKDAKVLLFSTEGITDMENWIDAVWFGKYSEN